VPKKLLNKPSDEIKTLRKNFRKVLPSKALADFDRGVAMLETVQDLHKFFNTLMKKYSKQK
jgi:hypothetical protein